ncbi:mCG147141 [Mus musculus]|nr:mCG147141 [Mus musculus]
MAGKLPLHVCRLCLLLRTQLSAPSCNGKCEGGFPHSFTNWGPCMQIYVVIQTPAALEQAGWLAEGRLSVLLVSQTSLPDKSPFCHLLFSIAVIDFISRCHSLGCRSIDVHRLYRIT